MLIPTDALEVLAMAVVELDDMIVLGVVVVDVEDPPAARWPWMWRFPLRVGSWATLPASVVHEPPT